jgi:hypothetical protein
MGLKSREKRWGFHNRQLKLTVKEERIPANFQLRSALPEAVLLFAVDLAAVSTTCGSSYFFAVGLVTVSTTRGSSSFCRRLGSSQHNLWQLLFLPLA